MRKGFVKKQQKNIIYLGKYLIFIIACAKVGINQDGDGAAPREADAGGPEPGTIQKTIQQTEISDEQIRFCSRILLLLLFLWKQRKSVLLHGKVTVTDQTRLIR